MTVCTGDAFIVNEDGSEEIVATPSFTDKARNRNLSDVYVDLFKLYGVEMPSFGEGEWRSTGQAS